MRAIMVRLERSSRCGARQWCSEHARDVAGIAVDYRDRAPRPGEIRLPCLLNYACWIEMCAGRKRYGWSTIVGAVMNVGVIVSAASIHTGSFVALVGTSHDNLGLSHEFQ